MVSAMMLTVILAGSHTAVFYLNYGILIPDLYLRGNHSTYFISVVVVLLFVVAIGRLGGSIFWTFEPPFPPSGPRTWSGSPLEKPPRLLFQAIRLVPVLLPSILALLISSILRVSEHALEKEREMDRLKTENYDAELKFLRSQINPHFLFNALNNIYSLSITKSSKTSELLLKLSGMLRYVLYECNSEKVSLQKEIEYIRNYIDLFKIKDERIKNIDFKFENTNLEISPMLLIPIVENAFKHSKIEDPEAGWIRIELVVEEGFQLSFTVENSVPKVTAIKDESQGIGIENLKKRLSYLYPARHDIIFDTGVDKYSVTLKLILK